MSDTKWNKGMRVKWFGKGLGRRTERTGTVRFDCQGATVAVRGDDGKSYSPYASWLLTVDTDSEQLMRNAAQDLYAALIEVSERDIEGPCFCDIPTGHTFLSHEPWCKQARAALAKARGE